MSEPLATILYYSANIEDPKFEQKVIDNIKKVNPGLPIISVTQKPIDLGKNICVGDVGWSYHNAWRQVLIGCKEVKTPYVIMAESDFLYPETGYFDFKPTDKNTIYTHTNVWMLFLKNERPLYYKKKQTHGSLIYPTWLAIEYFETNLKGTPMWKELPFNSPNKKKETKVHREEYGFTEFTSVNPLIAVITRANGRKWSPRDKSVRPRTTLPYWGKRDDLKEWLKR